MVIEFRVKHVHIPLFGIVEADNREAFWSAFAKSAADTPSVSVSDEVLDVLAEELGIDAEGLAADASRYVGGMYRAKARGLGGSRLGDFGEIITYLLSIGIDGRSLVRVVSWRAKGQPLKGHRFPQPDFLVKEGAQLGALEVKTTEAFVYQNLLKPIVWKSLEPCSGVRQCRKEALPQLGYSDGELTPQRHSLLLRDGQVVPFPADFGEAAAVLARDGRVEVFRNDKRYRVPKPCRDSVPPRNCWTCLADNEEPVHAVLVTMKNAPNRLVLVPPGENRDQWFSAYRRWSQAIWSRELEAVRAATGLLVRAVKEWVESVRLEPEERAILGAFWDAYILDVSSERGIVLDETAAGVSKPSAMVPEFGWTAAPLVPPRNVEAHMEELPTICAGLEESREVGAFSIVMRDRQGVAESFGVRVDSVGWCLTYMSQKWWNEEKLDDESAALIAARLVALALDLGGWVPLVERDRRTAIPLRRITAGVAEAQIHLGWVAKTVPDDRRAWRQWLRWNFPWGPWPYDFIEDGPHWLSLLCHGDRRVSLVILPDGRGRLRIPYLHGTIRR